MRCFEFDLNTIPQIILWGLETLIPPRLHKERYAPENIMYVIVEGELYLEEGGKEIRLREGDVYIFKKGDYHRPLKSTYCKYYYIHFETNSFAEYEMNRNEYYHAIREKRMNFLKADKYNSDCYNFMKAMLPQMSKIENKGFFEWCLNILENNSFKYMYQDMERRINILNAFLNFLIKLENTNIEQMEKNNHVDSSKIYNTVMRIVEYIEKNYMNDIGSQDIEREFFINFDYANRIFKKIMNCNIIKYRNLLRINAAKNIMRISDNTFDEVSEEIGFQDKCYFVRVFKKYEGITPGKYREQLMREKYVK